MKGGENSLEYLLRRKGLKQYEFSMTTHGMRERMTNTARQILAFILYLELTGQIIINEEIVRKPFPVDEEIQKALEVLAKNF